ncbi:MAG: MtrAB system histidine kinase MtrB [Nocardioidaceae bacterium]
MNALRRLLALLTSLGTSWRRSLQARVVLLTVLLSAIVVVLVGWTLLRQVSDNLIESKRVASLQQAAEGFDTAQEALTADPGNPDSSPVILDDLHLDLSQPGSASGLYEVLLSGPLASFSSSTAIGQSEVPAELLGRIAEDPARSAWTYARVPDPTGAEATVPALLVAAEVRLPADDDAYALTYVFPLDEQEDALNVVRRAMLTAGSLLVVLVAGVVYLVIRQVVTPVRLARRIAERLAAGRLQERMLVRGEDDIARLGTSFNQMAESLQKQIRQLEELSRVQRRFVSDVSHELRTPLTTVRMAADVLHEARDQFDGVTARSAELLQTELDRFESLLSDLLEISRFDAGVAALELDEVDLADLANRVVAATLPLAERRGSPLLVSTPGRPCVAQADVRRIERIVRNLVVNAIEYGEGSDITITVAASDHAAALTVRDRGVGLAKDEPSLVFNRFWRADPARARTSGGTGLGLAIAREDARLHGGWLQAWGELGHGTQFRLTLPRQAGEPIDRSPLPLVPKDVRHSGVGTPYARLDDGGGRS